MMSLHNRRNAVCSILLVQLYINIYILVQLNLPGVLIFSVSRLYYCTSRNSTKPLRLSFIFFIK